MNNSFRAIDKIKFQMKKRFLKIAAVLSIGSLLLTSCGPKNDPPLVYFPDMYYPIAYDPLGQAVIPYSDHENEIPMFVKNDLATGLGPVYGTVAKTEDNIIESNDDVVMSPDKYNGGYDISKGITASPLNASAKAKDLARGKLLYEQVCAACHGVNGNGQGPIVTSGAYNGVPNYADREITVGSVHYVMMHGRNNMGSYAGMLNAGDRWRVASYVMAAFKAGAPAAPMAAAPAVATTDPTATTK